MMICLRIRNSRSAYHSTTISAYQHKSQMSHEKKIDQTKGAICRLQPRDSALRYYTKPRRHLLSRRGHSWLALIHAWVRQQQTASSWPHVGSARTPCSLSVQRFNPEESLCSCTPMIPARRASTLRPNTTDSAGQANEISREGECSSRVVSMIQKTGGRPLRPEQGMLVCSG